MAIVVPLLIEEENCFAVCNNASSNSVADNDAMLKAVEKRFQKIKPYSSTEEAVKTFGDIYNFNRRDKVYFEVLYNEKVSQRSAIYRYKKKNAC